MFYTDQTAFNAAEPSATPVSFSGLTDGTRPNGFTLQGVTFSAAPGGGLIVFNGMLGNNFFGDTLALSFGSGVTAMGTDIVNALAETGAPPAQSAPITEEVFSGSTLIGQTTVTEASGFFGVVSTIPIAEVTFFSDCQSDCNSLLSNLSIVSAPPASVPEPSNLCVLLAALGIFTGIRSRLSSSA